MKYIQLILVALCLSATTCTSLWAQSVIPLPGSERYFCVLNPADKFGQLWTSKTNVSELSPLPHQQSRALMLRTKRRLSSIKTKLVSKSGKAKKKFAEKKQSERNELRYLLGGIRDCIRQKIEQPCEAVNASPRLSANTRLINGHTCNGLTSPVVPLLVQFPHSHAGCTGTVVQVSPLAILTAAHCVSDAEFGLASSVSALVGSREYSSETFLIHPLWTLSSAFDAAFLVFSASTDEVVPMPGVSASAEVQSDRGFIVAGYGATTAGSDPSGADGKLRAGYVQIGGSTSGSIIGSYVSHYSGVCLGDSGGPLLVYTEAGWRIAGINSAISARPDLCGVGSGLIFTNLLSSSVNRAFLYEYFPSMLEQ